MYRKEKRIPTLIVLMIIFIGFGITIYLDRFQQLNRTSAKENPEPSDIRFSNITNSSFNISWITSSPSIGSATVTYDSKNMIYIDDLDNDNISRPRTNHYITIKNLMENTVYTVKITSGLGNCNNDEKACPTLIQKTGNKLPKTNSLQPAHGSLISTSNQPVGNAIIYLTIGKSAILSGRTDSSGLWVIPLYNLRSSDLLSRTEISDNDIVQISAIVDNNQSSSAIIDAGSVRNNVAIPPLQIGVNHNFMNIMSKGNILANSQSQKILGTQTNADTKYNIYFPSYDGDTTTDNQPRFRGIGIKNSTLLITVRSSPQTARIVIENDGLWTWRPIQPLSPGEHTISIQAYNEKGELVSIDRKFVVLKSGERVLGEATASATLTPTGKPSPTITTTPAIISSPYPSPSLTVIPSPTIYLSPSVISSPAIRPPATGNLQSTILFIGSGGTLLLLGAVLLLAL